MLLIPVPHLKTFLSSPGKWLPGAYSIHVNGENKGSSTSSLTPASFNKVGNDFAGEILEVIAYDRALSDGVRQNWKVILLTNGIPLLQSILWLANSHPLTTTRIPTQHLVVTQILTFQPISDRQVGVAATLTITVDSGLTTFTFDSNDSSMVSFGGNATDGYTVTGLSEGNVTITATQGGQASLELGHR